VIKLEQPNKEYCKKLCYKNTSPEIPLEPTVLLGIIVSEDENFLTFRTARKQYRISKKCIISIEDTDEIFRDGVWGDTDD